MSHTPTQPLGTSRLNSARDETEAAAASGAPLNAPALPAEPLTWEQIEDMRQRIIAAHAAQAPTGETDAGTTRGRLRRDGARRHRRRSRCTLLRHQSGAVLGGGGAPLRPAGQSFLADASRRGIHRALVVAV